ncbi:MAG: 2-amino-4-hydroxy-6-hydroxymethyldihydropteridine diphosphokinase [Duncaniella sp.]|nr:2-amino-4-hydroxy-6-hydroxymethyldihydropteridine diphosphokinase [Muribaculum sp.]MCM1255244.1 2-amino-4-hydroxy-6-hydroxymethyldihydropteridine diphosphokinase [Duncaniella sp.]
MATIYLNIGSNKGDRQALIEQAIAFISSELQAAYIRRSKFIETAPWGFDSTNKFLNLGLALYYPSLDINSPDSLQHIFDIHSKLRLIERKVSSESHRDCEGNYIDREIDIDIIAIDDLTIDMRSLTIPHPRMHLRDFVLIPMQQLGPGWVHPILNKTAGGLLKELEIH